MLNESDADLEQETQGIEFYEKFESNQKQENPYLRKLKLLLCPFISSILLILFIATILTVTLVTFFTIPKKSTYNMIYVGDWGLDSPQQKNVAKMMSLEARKTNIDYILSMGDNFYWYGVDNVTDPLFKTTYENVYNIYDSLKNLHWYCILGNHDHRKPNSALSEIAYSKINPHWHMPFYYYTKESYLKSGERFQQIFIDTTRFDPEYQVEYPHVAKLSTKEVIDWLRNVLEAGQHTYRWRFVYGHHVMYSGGDYGDWGHTYMKDFESLFEEFQIDAYFCGHQHILQHIQIPYGPKNETIMDYFVNGAGGQTWANWIVTNHTHSKFSLGKSEGFMIHHLTTTESRVDIYNSTGDIAYSHTKRKDLVTEDDSIKQKITIKSDDIEIKGERMKPLDELIFSKYLKLEIIIPSKYKSNFHKNQRPNWYKIDPNYGLMNIKPEFERIIEINDEKHFIYFLYKDKSKDIGVSQVNRHSKTNWIKYFVEFVTFSKVLKSKEFYLISKPPNYYQKRQNDTMVKDENKSQKETKRKKLESIPSECFDFNFKEEEIQFSEFDTMLSNIEFQTIFGQGIPIIETKEERMILEDLETFDIFTPTESSEVSEIEKLRKELNEMVKRNQELEKTNHILKKELSSEIIISSDDSPKSIPSTPPEASVPLFKRNSPGPSPMGGPPAPPPMGGPLTGPPGMKAPIGDFSNIKTKTTSERKIPIVSLLRVTVDDYKKIIDHQKTTITQLHLINLRQKKKMN
eukprot:gene2898-4741_t